MSISGLKRRGGLGQLTIATPAHLPGPSPVSVEIVAGPDKLLTRLTLDLIRPIPIAGFRVDVENAA